MNDLSSEGYIVFEHIKKSYHNQPVLKDVSISVQEGEFIALLGSSGCGKTTLLRTLAGLASIDSGHIYIGGKEVTKLSPQQRGVSMIFQQYSLFPTMSVADNIAFGLKMQKKAKEERDTLVKHALEMVGLVESWHKFPSQLSGGEKQRVALARAIVTEKKILLLDEPFSAIDAKLRKSLQFQIRELHERLGITTIFVTHDQEEAMLISDRIYLLNEGQVEQFGTPEELYLQPKTEYAASFIGHYNIIKQEMSTLAFRPESVQLSSKKPSKDEPGIYFEGTIAREVTLGNIVRYTLSADSEIDDTAKHAAEHAAKSTTCRATHSSAPRAAGSATASSDLRAAKHVPRRTSIDIDVFNDTSSHFAPGDYCFAFIPESKILRYPL